MTINEDKSPQLVAVDFDPFAKGEVITMAPSTKGQREIWAAVQMEPAASLAFNESLSLRFRGPLDVERLREAFQRVLERHGSLRATFTPDGVWLCISSALPASLSVVDLSTLPAADQARTLADQARLEVEMPFDLVNGPLVRSQFFRLSAEEHVLFFTAHHIICDGWSQWVVLTELAALYSGQELPEPDSFARYVTDDIDGQEDEAYWRDRFAGGAPTLDLPTDRPRPRARSYDAAREDLELPESLVQGLQKLGARHSASLVATFLAGYAAFLHRLTGQEDLVIGVPAAGQARTGQDHLVGHCISLLPVRLSVKPGQPFSALLQGVRATFLDALDHQRPSFGRLLESLRLARDPARIPLLSAVFNMDRSAEKLNFQGLDVSYASHPRRYETFELFINASIGTGRFVLAAQYNTNLFEAATIRRRLLELQTLLVGAVADPERKVAQLPLLPDEELQKILVTFNQTEVDYRPPSSLHQLFERQADATPDRIAVVSQGWALTYRELEEHANQLAHRLRALGVKPNSCVAVCAERSLEMVIALYGVLKAGAAYLPLEPGDPRDRLAFLLDDAKPVAIVAQAAVADRIPAIGVPLLALGIDGRGLVEAPTTRPVCVTSGDDLAYVIYTSGSTGRPKGVANLHKGILNRILWMTERFGPATQERVLQKTPFTFDVSLWELFWPLSSGGCLIMAPPRAHQDPIRLAQVIAESLITMVHFVPSMLHAFLEHADLKTCASVRQVLCSGEVLPFDLQERFFQRWGVELHNLYGPTEAAVEVTHWQCVPGDARGIVPIGRALGNTRLYIVDQEGQPTPIGIPGELLIGGVQVARGYLGRPELTAERFVADPFALRPGDRVYRTGDRARFLDGGEIEFLGRLDDQVKVRGLRIEPGEIETVLAEYPGVRQAVLRVFEPKTGDLRLAAFYVPVPGADVSASDLRKHLRSKLPDYMVPQQFVAVERMPLTPSGKIDRKALALPAESGGVAGDRVAPHTPTERFLAELWADLVGIKPESIGASDNFFDVGGHSLLALQAIARIHARTGVRLEARAMFLNSLSQIAEMLGNSGESGELPAPFRPQAAAPHRSG
jgi:amino acid adenylation domain-containing protein